MQQRSTLFINFQASSGIYRFALRGTERTRRRGYDGDVARDAKPDQVGLTVNFAAMIDEVVYWVRNHHRLPVRGPVGRALRTKKLALLREGSID